MITRLIVDNFKPFKSLQLRLAPLTVLTGSNSTGKSSVIQALLLAQTAAESSTSVPLNGPFGLALGEALDVLNAQATDQTISFALHGPNHNEIRRFIVPEERSVSLNRGDVSTQAEVSGLRDGHIDQYLGAERLGPRDLLDIAPVVTETIPLGEKGQFTAHALALLDRQRIDGSRLYPGTVDAGYGTTLGEQVQAWVSWIVHSVNVEARWLPGTGAATLRFRDPNVRAEWTRPTNVGFGVSYALPIIVAGLTARPGTLFIVENPEAHLHPAGQSRIGQFLVRVAAAGVQTIVESHSDHLINGMRIAVVQDSLIGTSEVVIHYFDGSGIAHEILLEPSGGLSSWPPGFFDQIELDLGVLSRAGRGG